jgi:hypothetical protein
VKNTLIKDAALCGIFYYLEKKYFILMKKLIFIFLAVIIGQSLLGQITEMKWELDYEIYLKLANDSNLTYDIREAFHVTDTKQDYTSDFVFYPVNPGEEYANDVPDVYETVEFTTLWSALSAKVGGGWVHFINCIAYALETQKLDLSSPLMQRPESDWRPKPMTDSYKRTKKWIYYVPLSQKNAQKEYKIRLSEGTLGDLKSLPSSYIELFLATNQKDYDLLKSEGKNDVLAKINLVKVIMGANYLGETQITYMSNMILESVKSYSTNMLPSVIVFDEYEAAAVMSLNADGYKIEKVVFRSSSDITEQEMGQRTKEIENIITKINAYNQDSFKKRLGNYYRN